LDDRRNELNKIGVDKSMNVKIDAFDYQDLNNECTQQLLSNNKYNALLAIHSMPGR
jgi:hypothetical protein